MMMTGTNGHSMAQAEGPPIRLTTAGTEMSLARKLQWLLRISMAGTYIGHGAFGIIGKEAWLPYFNLFGLTDSQAWALMPVVGSLDIALGILILVWPMRAAMLHLAVWGLLTASLRPLVGEGTWQEVFERAGNYCVPTALLVLTGWGGDSISNWFRRVGEASVLTQPKAHAMHWILRVGTALLLIGHGGFGVWMHKQAWFGYFAALGIGEQTVTNPSVFYIVGWFEIAVGLAVLFKPVRPLLVFVCAYKVGTELLRPMVGEPWWEFIERAGSYMTPAALILVDRWRSAKVPGDDTQVPSWVKDPLVRPPSTRPQSAVLPGPVSALQGRTGMHMLEHRPRLATNDRTALHHIDEQSRHGSVARVSLVPK